MRKQSSNGGQRVVLLGGNGASNLLIILQKTLLTSYKILLRKQCNRANLGAAGVRAVGLLVSIARNSGEAAEGSNAILNMCYEASNVSLLVEEVGVKFLVQFLSSRDVDVQASAAGALQSICFQYCGRSAAKEAHVISALVPLMCSEHNNVRDRAIGCVHNLSSDSLSIRELREMGAIPNLVDLLACSSPQSCTAAAGTIQNISREPLSRTVLMEEHHPRVVESLSSLLFGSDVQGQACAAGALLNLIGPDLEGAENKDARSSFKKILSESIAMGTVWQSVFEVDRC